VRDDWNSFFPIRLVILLNSYLQKARTFNYTKLAMAAIECKLAMCTSRLVEFELQLELNIEQKKGTSLVKLVSLRENPRHHQCADRASVRPSDKFWILRVVPLGPCL
jgi:hypothetical protein